MERRLELLELLNTLLITGEYDTVSINKNDLKIVLTCLQVTQTKVRLIQTQTRLPQNELQWNNLHFF
jgi:hypothetical protein